MSTWLVERPQRLTFDEVKQLRVRVIAGRVDVVGTDDETAVDVTEIRRRPLRIQYGDGALTVAYEPTKTPTFVHGFIDQHVKRAMSVLTITVPRDCEVEIESLSADVRVSDLDGKVTVHTLNAPATLVRLPGDVAVDSVSGSVRMREVAGDLWVRNISGEVTLVESVSEVVEVETVSGAITCDLASPVVTGVSLATYTGHVTVRVPDNSDLSVDLRTTNGVITTPFTGLRHELSPLFRRVRGALGDDGGRLQVRTVTGRVALLSRPPERSADADPLGEFEETS